MGSIIEALSGFTGHVKLLQTGIQNLSHNIIPGVLNSAKTLSTELSQLSPEVLKNLHSPTTLLNTGTNVSLSAPDIQTSTINQGCLILKYFKNSYKYKSGQICKVMSQ